MKEEKIKNLKMGISLLKSIRNILIFIGIMIIILYTLPTLYLHQGNNDEIIINSIAILFGIIIVCIILFLLIKNMKQQLLEIMNTSEDVFPVNNINTTAHWILNFIDRYFLGFSFLRIFLVVISVILAVLIIVIIYSNIGSY